MKRIFLYNSLLKRNKISEQFLKRMITDNNIRIVLRLIRPVLANIGLNEARFK